MISTVNIKAGDVFKILGEREFTFGDDLNIIYGQNGVGKSLLLKTIKNAIFIDDVGVNTPNNIFRFESYEKFLTDNRYGVIDIIWDGAGCFYLPNKYFQDDHKNLGYEMSTGPVIKEFGRFMQRWQKYLSNGQMSLSYFDEIYNLELASFDTMARSDEPYFYRSFNEFAATKTGGGKPTLLLDEIDSNLSLHKQKWFHEEYLPKLAKKFQVIIVSHSPFIQDNFKGGNTLIDMDGTFYSDRELLKTIYK